MALTPHLRVYITGEAKCSTDALSCHELVSATKFDIDRENRCTTYFKRIVQPLHSLLPGPMRIAGENSEILKKCLQHLTMWTLRWQFRRHAQLETGRLNNTFVVDE